MSKDTRKKDRSRTFRGCVSQSGDLIYAILRQRKNFPWLPHLPELDDRIRTCFAIVRPFSGGDFLASGEHDFRTSQHWRSRCCTAWFERCRATGVQNEGAGEGVGSSTSWVRDWQLQCHLFSLLTLTLHPGDAQTWDKDEWEAKIVPPCATQEATSPERELEL